MKKSVKKLITNYRIEGDIESGVGEDFDPYEVGQRGVVSIEENQPANGVQLWNFLIKYEDGSEIRVFNPNKVPLSWTKLNST